MATGDNLYNFSGEEKIVIPGIPDFERTSTFVFKANFKNGVSNTLAQLWNNWATTNGVFIETMDDADSTPNSIRVAIIAGGGNSIFLWSGAEEVSTTAFQDIEVAYDGSSTAAGVVVKVNNSVVTMGVVSDNLISSTLTGSNGFVIGRKKDELESLYGDFVLDSLSWTVDGSLIFDTECDDKGLTVTDLSGEDNDGDITLNGSTTFYLTSGEKYKYYFYWDHDSNNNYYKVSIIENGYASTVTTLTPGPDPWSISVDGQLDTITNPILGSEAKFSIIADGAEFTTYDEDFLASDYKDFIVKLIQDPDGTPIIKWVGILMPANATRNYFNKKKVYQLSAVDGLADLKNKKYSSDGADSGSVYNGLDNMLNIIKNAVATVADITELQLDFRINLGTYSDQMTAVSGLLHTDQALKDNEIVQEIFSEEKDDETIFDNCYEVMQKILIPFDCTFMQSDGYYWIICTGESNGTYYWEYDWATLTEQSRTQWSTKHVDAESYKWIGNGTLYKTLPFKEFDVRLYNKNYDPELIINGGFDEDISGWTNGDANDSSNTWTDNFEWFDYSAIGGTLSAAWAGAATTGKYNFHSTNAITIEVGAGKQNVTIYTTVELYSSTPGPDGSLSSPKIKQRLWNATNGYTSGTIGAQNIGAIGGFVTYREVFDITGLTVTNNYVDIEIEVTDASTTSIQLFFDGVSMTQGSENIPTDWLYKGAQTAGSQTANREVIAYMAEKQESDNDICAIKDSGGTYVSTWGRWNFPAETRPLLEILQQYQFNSNRRYMSYVRGTIYDPDETININNVLTLDEGDFRIIGIDKDYRSATIAVDLIEIIYVGALLPDDTTFDVGLIKLSSQYGQSQD